MATAESQRKKIESTQQLAQRAIQKSRFVLVRNGEEVATKQRYASKLQPKLKTGRKLSQEWLNKGMGSGDQHVPESMAVRKGLPGLMGVDSGATGLTMDQYKTKLTNTGIDAGVNLAKRQVARFKHNFEQLVAATVPPLP